MRFREVLMIGLCVASPLAADAATTVTTAMTVVNAAGSGVGDPPYTYLLEKPTIQFFNSAMDDVTSKGYPDQVYITFHPLLDDLFMRPLGTIRFQAGLGQYLVPGSYTFSNVAESIVNPIEPGKTGMNVNIIQAPPEWVWHVLSFSPDCKTVSGTFVISRADYEGPLTLKAEGGNTFNALRFAATFSIACDSNAPVTGEMDVVFPHVTGYIAVSPPPGSGNGSDSGGPTPVTPPDVTVALPAEIVAQPFVLANAQAATIPFSLAVVDTFSNDLALSARSDPDGLIVTVDPPVIPAPGSGDGSVSFSSGPMTRPGDYRIDVTATSTNPDTGEQKSYNASFHVELVCDPPMILGLQQPRSATVARGSAVSLHVNPNGSGPFTYQWYSGYAPLSRSPITGATDAVLTIPSLTDTGYFWVRVSNACGTANSQTATISVR